MQSHIALAFGLAVLAAGLPAAGHEHRAPHGGTLVAFGDEFAHIELVLDPAKGSLAAFVLDGEAERGVRVEQTTIRLSIEPEARGARLALSLGGVPNVLTGESVGNTSEFRATHEQLRGLQRFEAEIARIEVKGRVFENVRFHFPEGNEGEEREAGHGAH